MLVTEHIHSIILLQDSKHEQIFNIELLLNIHGGELTFTRSKPAQLQVPTLISYGATLSSLEKSGQWQQVLCLLREMQSAEVVPNLICWNAVISCCQKTVLQWPRAVGFLRDMETPDVISYNGVISSCEKASEWTLALELLGEMVAVKIRQSVISYSAAISACEKGSLGSNLIRPETSYRPSKRYIYIYIHPNTSIR